MESSQETLEITDSLKRLIRSKARQVVGKAGLTHSDRADVEQDLWLDLLERWPKFRSDRASTNTFINRVLNHKVAMILRERRTAKRASSHNGRSLDVLCQDEDGETVTKAVLLHENVHHRRTGQSAPSTFEMLAMKVDMTSVLSSLATRHPSMRRRSDGMPNTSKSPVHYLAGMIHSWKSFIWITMQLPTIVSSTWIATSLCEPIAQACLIWCQRTVSVPSHPSRKATTLCSTYSQKWTLSAGWLA